jgi:hypothetical protein
MATMTTDPLLTLLEFLLEQEELVNLLGNRIWVDTVLPDGYHVDNGPALLVSSRNSQRLGQGTSKLWRVSAQFLSYGATQEAAWVALGLLYQILEEEARRGANVRAAHAETIGQSLPRDPETGWPAMLAYYEITIVSQRETIPAEEEE